MRIWLLLTLWLAFDSCTSQKPELKTGVWRGLIEMQGQQLPFNFEVVKTDSGFNAYLKNGTEKIVLDEVSVIGDSLKMVLHIFDAELKAKIGDDRLSGYYNRNFIMDYRLPFHATWGDNFRFEKVTDAETTDFSGKYAVQFVHEKDTTSSVGIFKQHGSYAEGTFLNPDGDYRYLEGNIVNGKLWLSAFDGHHAYIFTAMKRKDNTLAGDYWSGKTWHQTWSGVPNDKAALPDADSITYLKKGYEKLEFSFPDVNGNKISPSDERYLGKVLIVQLFGTWCPNCMDETKFLSRWYKKNRDRGVGILALAYEQKDDFQYASSRIRKMKQKLDVDYDFVVAGTNDKLKASQTLPALSEVFAFPTTIFIGKDGKVKHIHTGFTGPATGVYYEQFVQRFNETVDELLNEKLPSTSKK
jgi:thiol-disulfide isomerase/thioredoxin